MRGLRQYIEEQLSDVKTKWHPKKGLFTGDDPKEIVDYLLKNSKDETQAMQRLCFYMNRAGNKLTNKTVLNKAKSILKSKKVEEKLIINKELVQYNNSILTIHIIQWKDKNKLHEDQIMFTVVHLNDGTMRLENDNLYILAGSKKVVFNKYYNYWYWGTEIDNLKINIIALHGNDGVIFLKSLKNKDIDKLNIHDYFDKAPDENISVWHNHNKVTSHDSYTKKDIENLIEQMKR